LPSNFQDLDTDKKEIALFQKYRAICAKAYEVATYLNNHDAYTAKRKFAEPLRELFRRIEDTSDDGIVPLRTCLIQIFEKWEEMQFPDQCPIYFTPTEVASHGREFLEYSQWHEVQNFAKKYLSRDAEGWVPPEADWDKKQLQNKMLLDFMVERLETQKTAEEVRQMWPFPT